LEVVKESVDKFIDFRQTEGNNLAEEIEKIVQNIEYNLSRLLNTKKKESSRSKTVIRLRLRILRM
jgi:uncharacterized protein YicC (UPF0701 family)